MNLNFLRGLFGSSVRQAYGDQPDIRGTYSMSRDVNPAIAARVVDSMGGTGAAGGDVGPMKRPPVAVGNPERSYLGGLVKYQRPEGQTNAERMALIGATLSDVGSAFRGGEGGSLSRVQEQYRKHSQLERLRQMAKQAFPDDPSIEAMMEIDPDVVGQAWLEKHKAPEMTYVEGPDGIYAVNKKSGESRRVQSYPEKADASPGWRKRPDGAWEPVPGGPYDPAYIAKTAGIRRDEIVSRPMPRTGGRSTGLPSGFVLD